MKIAGQNWVTDSINIALLKVLHYLMFIIIWWTWCSSWYVLLKKKSFFQLALTKGNAMTNLFWISHSKFFCFTKIVGFSYCTTIFFSSWIYFTREYLIYLHVSPVLKFVSFLEVGMLGFYFDPKGPLPVTFLKNRGMDLWPKRPFSTYQTKLPRYTNNRRSRPSERLRSSSYILLL